MRRATLLLDITCAACGQSFEWLAREGDALPTTCSQACEDAEAARLAGLCLRCRTQPRRWRGLCLDCFPSARAEAVRRGGWGVLVAEGRAAARAVGHGNPESRPCGEPGCDRKATHRGICKLHADRRRRREAFLRRLEATQ